jgi:hypothetical protein
MLDAIRVVRLGGIHSPWWRTFSNVIATITSWPFGKMLSETSGLRSDTGLFRCVAAAGNQDPHEPDLRQR